MATPNVGILTNAGKNLIDQVNAGKTKITFSKIVFSSMDNSQLSDMQVKALTAIAPQEVVVSSPETTLDTNSGETRIRATGTNEKLADGVYVKTYGVFAKDDTGSEILYGVTVSPNPNYFPAYDGVTPQAVTYSYKTVIQETSNITMTNSNDVYASQEDLTEALQPYAKTVDVNQQLDKKVNIADMRKPAGDVAGIEEVNAKADDAKVAHLSGANNFDTVPTVKNNPLLLASSLPSDLARTGQDQEFTGKNTFDVAPIDKTTGNPYITKDGVPAVPSTLADTTKDANFTGKLQKSGIDVATKTDVTTAVSTATANMANPSKPTNFTAGLKSGGIDVATAADLKSVEDSAWRELDNQYVTRSTDGKSFQKFADNSSVLYKIDEEKKFIYFSFIIYSLDPGTYSDRIDFSSIVKNISFPAYYSFNLYNGSSGDENTYNMSIANNQIEIKGYVNSAYFYSIPAEYQKTSSSGHEYSRCFVSYDELV